MVNYLIYRLGHFIAVCLPLRLSYTLADLVCTIQFIIAGKDRRAVIANFRAIFPEKSRGEILLISWKMFRNFGRYLAVFFKFALIDDKFIKKHVVMENMEYISESLKKYGGVIATTAHIGNWELAAAVTALRGYPVVAVAMVHKNKRIDEFFNKQRGHTGVEIVPLGGAVKKCLKALKERKVVALVGDRDFTRGGFRLDFFGRTAIIPRGPAMLAFKANTPIIPGFITVQKDGKFNLRFEEPILPVATGNEEKDVVELAKRCLRIIEGYIRRYPEQWFMFRQFWI
ncbi:MAG: lysophospholipid acyltransferase family protein [Candidatus Omnitrophica bacterium]|nr:lysophospholipid acyltransferase family protein [Candidatus Omnitrophota bacterium]